MRHDWDTRSFGVPQDDNCARDAPYTIGPHTLSYLRPMIPLPIDKYLPDVIAAARQHRAMVLVAPSRQRLLGDQASSNSAPRDHPDAAFS